MYIKKHKHLDLKLWTDTNELKKIVSEMLMSIVWSYIDNVRGLNAVDVCNSDIKDVFIYGSCANYFYTNKSDIDMCIILDFDKIFKRNPGLKNEQNFKLYYYNWAMTHKCKIYGRKIDVSFEDEKNTISPNGRYRSGPVYSVMHNRWLFKPAIISDKEYKKIEKDSRLVCKQILHDYNVVKKNGFVFKDVQKLYKDIYYAKNISHKMNLEQPITYMYVAFRKIRGMGILDKLRDKMVEIESEHFVLK